MKNSRIDSTRSILDSSWPGISNSRHYHAILWGGIILFFQCASHVWAQTPTFTPTVCPSSSLSWSTQAPMPTGRDRFAAGAVNGILYFVGGQNGSGDNLTTVEAYNPATNTWTPGLAPLPTGMEDMAVAVVGGILYAIGGYDGTTVYNTVQAYNPATNTWSAMAPMPTARCNLAVGVVNGIIYAVGGDNAAGNPLSTVEAYNPTTNTWTAGLAAMPTARSQLTVGVVNGMLYAAGGGDGVGLILDSTHVIPTLEAYNPATNTWTAGLAPEPTGVEEALGGVMNGSLYVVGGCSNTAIINQAESYNPVSNSWTVQNTMPVNQCAQAGGVVNNAIYSVGGWGMGFMTNNQVGTLNCGPSPTNTPLGSNTPTQTMTFSPTPSYTPNISNSPTITITPTATVPFNDVFYVDHNIFTPSQGSVSIYVDYTYYPGPYSLKIYNTAGELIRDLSQDSTPPMNPLPPSYLTSMLPPQYYHWDGTNYANNKCADGVYILYLVEPFNRKIKKILLVH